MASEFRVKNQKKLIAELDSIARKYPKAARGALFSEGQRLKSIAVVITPKGKTGSLHRSIIVQKPEVRGKLLLVIVGTSAQSPAAKYAEAQHQGPGGSKAPPSWSGLSQLNYTTSKTGKLFLTKARGIIRKDFVTQMAKKIQRRI